MLKGLALGAIMVVAGFACVPAHAQQGGRQSADPNAGAFGASEAPFEPAEAVHQVELISQALASIPAQRPGVIDTYVLSIAFWDEPVFENEAKEAAAILARRYDASDRTVVLTAGKGGGTRTYPA